jgi:putative addiction module component (TIGR02574 family)
MQKALTAADCVAVSLTDAQRAELQRRVEEDNANPSDVTHWKEIKASTLYRLKR